MLPSILPISSILLKLLNCLFCSFISPIAFHRFLGFLVGDKTPKCKILNLEGAVFKISFLKNFFRYPFSY